MSLRLVLPLPAGTPGDPGLTGPGSVTWHVSRERVVPLGGLSAFMHAVHVVMGRLAPPGLRFWNHYHVAVARCRRGATPGPAR